MVARPVVCPRTAGILTIDRAVTALCIRQCPEILGLDALKYERFVGLGLIDLIDQDPAEMNHSHISELYSQLSSDIKVNHLSFDAFVKSVESFGMIAAMAIKVSGALNYSKELNCSRFDEVLVHVMSIVMAHAICKQVGKPGVVEALVTGRLSMKMSNEELFNLEVTEEMFL